MHMLSGNDFFKCFNRSAPRRFSTRLVAFLEREREREMRETRLHLDACVRVRGAHFEHEF